MKPVNQLSDKELCSVINLGLNGNPKYWNEAVIEAHKRKIYFKEYDKK